MSNTAADFILSRKNAVLACRERQLEFNRLAVEGGKPYINARLWRAPNESETSWNGSPDACETRDMSALRHHSGATSFGMVGRRDRTTLVNDAGRIAGKIEQYLFKNPVARAGADAEWLLRVGGSGVDALRFWMGVNTIFTAQQWAWIQVSRDFAAQTLAERGARDAIKWTAFPPRSVPDWAFGDDGVLDWILVESFETDAGDPFTPPVKRVVRTLWRREGGGVSVTRFTRGENEQAMPLGKPQMLAIPEIPFVLIGKPTESPWWFDDVEAIAAQLLNLDSIHIDNLVRCVFPQLIISEGTYDSLNTKLVQQYGAERGEIVMQVVKEIVRGADMPIVESAEERGTTRFICPNTTDLAALPTEIERKRKLLFDITGLSLFNKETRQTQTAESKQFDQLDTESTLKNRALLMEAAEKKLVALSKVLDPLFADYDPQWPTSFDVPDTESDMRVISTVANLPDTTPSMRKLAMRAAVRVLSAINGADEKLLEAANAEIDATDFSDAALAKAVAET